MFGGWHSGCFGCLCKSLIIKGLREPPLPPPNPLIFNKLRKAHLYHKGSNCQECFFTSYKKIPTKKTTKANGISSSISFSVACS